jgi:hypothetical protein
MRRLLVVGAALVVVGVLIGAGAAYVASERLQKTPVAVRTAPPSPHVTLAPSPLATAPTTTSAPPAPAAAAATPAPVSSAPAVGIAWACASDQSDDGTVDPSSDARLEADGAVPSTFCQQHMTGLEPGAHAFRLPVGTFTPFPHCGGTVVNIVDPFDRQGPPAAWLGYHEYLFGQDWNSIPEGVC